jgi:hypothetical protein
MSEATPDLYECMIAPLEEANLQYMITGSVASMAYGEPRLTNDIDLVLALSESQLPRFIQAFPLESFYCAPLEVLKIECARAQRGHTNIVHHDSGFRADVYFFGEDALHQWAWPRRHRLLVTETLTVSLAPPEYVIVRKLQFHQEGHSPKHLSDIASMLNQLQSEDGAKALDMKELDGHIQSLGLTEIWNLAQEQR